MFAILVKTVMNHCSLCHVEEFKKIVFGCEVLHKYISGTTYHSTQWYIFSIQFHFLIAIGCVHADMRSCMACAHACMRVCVHVCTHTRTCMHSHVHAYTHACIRACAHTYTHIHTHPPHTWMVGPCVAAAKVHKLFSAASL